MKHYWITLAVILLLTVTYSCTREQKTTAPPVPLAASPASNAPSENLESLLDDYESKDRNIWQKPELVISLLGNLKGKTVADIGAGTGYFAFRLVPKAEKVIGIEIDQRYVQFMDSMKVRLPKDYKTRFEARLAKHDDPMLAPKEVDAVMIVNTYAYIEQRPAYLKILNKGMSDQSRLLIIDFKKNNLPVGPPEEYKVSSRQVESELMGAGFKIVKTDIKSLDYQYIVLAEKKL